MAHRILRHLATKTGRLLAAGLLISTVTGGALAVQGANDAKAAVVWCSGDPTILVNGNPVSVTVSVPTERLRDVDYVTITFHVPSNANVQAILNTSVLFREKTVIVKDQPPVYGLVANVRIPVEVTTTARGTAFPIGTTVVSTIGTRVWIDGSSNKVTRTETNSLFNLRLF